MKANDKQYCKVYKSAVILLFLFIAISCVYIQYNSYRIKTTERERIHNLAQKGLSLKEIQDPLLEYTADQRISIHELVKGYSSTISSAEVVVLSDTEYIDTSMVGTKQVNFKLVSYDEYGEEVSKECRRLFYVRDTVFPTIKFAEKSVVIAEGDLWKPEDNVKSVFDTVDGELESISKSDIPAHLYDGYSEPEQGTTQFYDHGWYFVDSDADLNCPGTYTVRITACDKNGNIITDSFDVTVEAKAKSIASMSYKRQDESYSTGSVYTGNHTGTANNGTSQNLTSTSTGSPGGSDVATDMTSPVNPIPSTTPEPIIDTSIPTGTFPTYSAASAWANAQLDADMEAWYAGTLPNPRTGFYADANYTASGIEYWVVTFY